MNISYVLDQPQLCGGVKVVFQHAGLLRSMGHRVTILANGPRPDWIGFRGGYIDVSAAEPRIPPQDLVVATYWTTVDRACALDAGPVVHFCQGYEGDLPHLAGQRPAIEDAYRRAIPAWVVAPHLGARLATMFEKPSVVVSPPVDPLFRPRWRIGPRRRPRVLLHGIFEAVSKGIVTGLKAVSHLRASGVPCRLDRFSTFPLTAEERSICDPDRYECGVRPATVARATRGGDLLLFTSDVAEGFGLPVLEAMASGLPVVATRIPSVEHMTDGAVPLVPPGDSAAMAAEAERLLRDGAAWRKVREAGRIRVRRFSPREVAAELANALEWALRETGGRRA